MKVSDNQSSSKITKTRVTLHYYTSAWPGIFIHSFRKYSYSAPSRVLLRSAIKSKWC